MTSDAIFAEPRLAALYDVLESDRSDLDAYLEMVRELGARSVVDVGCGTGTLCCELAARGLRVTGVDPAAASLAVARGKTGAGGVRWECSGAAELAAIGLAAAEVVTMTANVAQVFVTDAAWTAALAGVSAALAPGATFIFETRDPAARAWEAWTPERTRRALALADGGAVRTFIELLSVAPPLVSFRQTFTFEPSGEVLCSDSTLRFRSRVEVADSLRSSGLEVVEVRDAPDRPGLEFVFIARRSSEHREGVPGGTRR